MNGDATRASRHVAAIMRRMWAVVVVACAVPVSRSSAQNTAADSAEVYVTAARGLDSSSQALTKARAFPLWKRAAELFRERGDTRKEAEAMVGAARARVAMGGDPGAMRLVVFPLLRNAATLYLSVRAKREAADALFAIPVSTVQTQGITIDTMLAITADGLKLRRELRDRKGEAEFLSQLSMLTRDSKSAISYAMQALTAARAARDTTGQLSILSRLQTQYVRQWREDSLAPPRIRQLLFDSATRYNRDAIRLARQTGNVKAELVQVSNLSQMFAVQAAQSRGATSPRARDANLDSAFHYAHEGVRVAHRAQDAPAEIAALARVADLHRTDGIPDSVRYYARQAVVMARAGSDTAQLVAMIAALARSEAQAWPDSAVARFREQERLLQSPSARSRLPDVWMSIAGVYRDAARTDSSLTYFRRVAETDLVATNSGIRAVAFLNIAYLFQGRSQSDSAERYFRLLREQGMSLRNELWTVRADVGLGRLLMVRGAFDSAITVFSTLLRRSPTVEPAITLDWLATAEEWANQYDSAMVHRRKSIDLYRRAGASFDEARSFKSLASSLDALGKPDSALVQLRAALNRAQGRGNEARTADMLLLAGLIFAKMDLADSAFVYDRRALSMAGSLNDLRLLAEAQNAVGVSFLNIAQLDSARAYLSAAAASGRAGGFRREEGNALLNLASVLRGLERADSALLVTRQAIALRASAEGSRELAADLSSLASAYLSAGLVDSSIVYARRMLTMANAMSSPAFEGEALSLLTHAFLKAESRDSSFRYAQRTIDMMRSAGDSAGIRFALGNIAELLRLGGSTDLRRATSYFDSAAVVTEGARRAGGDDFNVLAIADRQKWLFEGWARAWIGRRDEVGAAQSAASAFAAVERGRAQALLDLLARRTATLDTAAVVRHRPVAGADLSREADSLLAPIRAVRAAALSYLVVDDTLFTWLLTPSGSLDLQTPVAIDWEELKTLILSSRRTFGAVEARASRLDPSEQIDETDSLSLRGRNPEDDWKKLASLLLPADLTRKVPPGTPIVIVPNGPIALVPFAALAIAGDTSTRRSVGTASGRASAVRDTLLGTRHPLRFAPSFAALRASESNTRVNITPALRTASARTAWRKTRGTSAPSTPNKGPATRMASALVIGNPSMPSLYSGRVGSRGKLQPLPGAEAEARAIATRLGAEALVGRKATETVVRERMSAAPLIHFATHGLAYGEAAGERRSFVAFAPDSLQDGFLTVGDLMDDPTLKISAELVVLSACQTGLGSRRWAEGTVGLQRAFLAKGARSVLVSLWNVDDKATRLLMEKFYAYWLDPNVVRTKTQALQMAQEAVRRTPGYANPKYWAAFQLVGAE